MGSQAASAVLSLVVIASGGGERGGEHHFNAFEYFSTVINFVVMFGFLAYVLKQPLATFLETRRDSMAKGLVDAREKQAAAEKRIAEYKNRLENLESEVQRIVSSYEREAEAERDRMRQDTDRAIERITREADFAIKQEVRKAERAIREAAATATLDSAESLVKERITEADQRRLADAYIMQLEANPAGRSPAARQ